MRLRRRLPLRLPQQTLLRHLVVGAVLALVLYVLSLLFAPFDDLRLATAAYYFAALAGLTVLTGLNGQISLGHGALMAIGAYTTVLLISRESWPLAPALVAGTLSTALIGVAIGGENGLQVNPPTPPSALGANFPLERWQAWITCIGALIVFVLLANLLRSRVGRSFRAVRDDEVAARLAGLDVGRVQVLAFVVSAACAGLGGGLLVVVNSLAAPGAFTLSLSLSLLTGIVLGGLGSLAGAAWGAVALVMLPAWTHDIANAVSLPTKVQSNLPLVLYGLILIGVIVAAPQGIQGALRAAARWLGRRVSTTMEEGA